MPETHTEWTADMLDDLPDDGNRYEVIDGELLVTPTPVDLHQHAIAELYLLLAPYCKRIGLNLLFALSAVRFSNRREVQPDLYATPRLSDGRRPERFTDIKVALLVVEVLSPSTMRTDRFKKRRVYQEEGVADYWIIDTSHRVIERWRPDYEEPDILLDSLEWKPVAEKEVLVIDVDRYFRAVHGEL